MVPRREEVSFPSLWEETEENGTNPAEQNPISGQNEEFLARSRQVDEETPTRPSRQRVLPAHLQDYILTADSTSENEDLIKFCLFADSEQVSFHEAIKDPR